MAWPAPTVSSEAIRAGDGDREIVLDLLREHWLAGRLTLTEYEERCEEVARARFISELDGAVRELPADVASAAEPSSGAAIASCALGVVSLGALLFTFGLVALVTLPMSIAAWALGHFARRRATPSSRGLAIAGEVTGIIGTIGSLLALSVFALILSSV